MVQIDPVKQREFAVEVVTTLRAAGYEALWAGGCVRDQLLRREPKDFDVACSATPDQIRDVFGHRRTLPIGAAFGVVCVVGSRGAGQIEVATFRKDGGYSDGRHPDDVTFSTAEEDALRRDFTINGLFFDPVSEDVIDFVGGEKDITGRIVRAIGDPESRISEDKLRMLRGIRFAATLDFELDAATLAAIKQMAGQLEVVSAERIAAEMRRMLMSKHRVSALQLLRDTGLWAMIFPTAVSPPQEGNWQRMLDILQALDNPSFPLSLASLLISLTDEVGAIAVSRQWKLSNQEEGRAVWLVRHHAALDGAVQRKTSAWQRVLTHEGGAELVELLAARVVCGTADAVDVDFCRDRLNWPEEKLNPPLLVTGDDLQEHGIPPGKAYQTLLTAIRDAQLDEEIVTKDDALALADQLMADEKG